MSPCLEVSATTRESAMTHDMGDYFVRSFFPLQVMLVLGRSYAAETTCERGVAIDDPWKELASETLVMLVLLLLACIVFLVLSALESVWKPIALPFWRITLANKSQQACCLDASKYPRESRV